MTTSILRQLANIILESVDEIETTLGGAPGGLPSLDVPIMNPAEMLLYAQIQGPAKKIKAACGQLSASVASPVSTLADGFWGYHLSSCLKVVGTINAAEVIREAGPQGLHVQDICKPSGTDPDKIARVLRLLATHHIFREVKPDVFTHNRLSCLLDSGCSVDELFNRPDRKRFEKFLAPRGAIPALVELMVDDAFTASTKLTECLTESATAKSVKPTDASWNLAFGTQLPIMEWQQLPENELRRIRFDVAQGASAGREGSLKGINWKGFPPDSTIVDVGGGRGGLFVPLAKEHQHLNFVVQDLGPVIQGGEAFWKKTYPEAIQNGQVKFQELDFFQPQPVKNAAVFILRHIIHDWPDTSAVQILKNLRDAAQPSTKLIIIDVEVPFACEDIHGGSRGEVKRVDFPEWVGPPAPKPLLPNYGTGNLGPYWLDVLMLMFNNGKERTMPGFQKLAEEAGWEIEEVYYLRESSNLQIIARPVQISRISSS